MITKNSQPAITLALFDGEVVLLAIKIIAGVARPEARGDGVAFFEGCFIYGQGLAKAFAWRQTVGGGIT